MGLWTKMNVSLISSVALILLVTQVFGAASSKCGNCTGANGECSGAIKSPDYPDQYPNSKDKSTIIKVCPGEMILLTFLEFGLEYDLNCNYDYLKVVDTDGSELMKECGTKEPFKVFSSGNSMTVNFSSDHSITDKGFNATWKRIKSSSIKTIIESSNHPQNYDDNTQQWKLKVQSGSKIELNFETFDLEEPASNDYCFDFVEVSYGIVSEKYCGTTKPGTITSIANNMKIKFQSDNFGNAKGFKAVWKEVK